MFPDPPVAAYVPPLGFKDTDHAVQTREGRQTFNNYTGVGHAGHRTQDSHGSAPERV
jgi:hypothetical protein